MKPDRNPKPAPRPGPGAVLALLLVAATASAASRPVLKTIAVDGNPADWSDVVANDFQTTVDGNGILTPCSGIDLDCEVQSTGRDLGRFAWTYDATNIYLYLERLGSDSNSQSFYFYMDVDRNRRMDATDFVLKVEYKGANRSAGRVVYRYVPCGASGCQAPPLASSDDLVEPCSAVADGWTLCGTLGSAVATLPAANSGFASGNGFEVAVPWSALSLTQPTPIFFHVASANGNSVPGQIDDNCGGPNDGIGSFGFFAADLFPDRTAARAPGTDVTFAHTVTNIGTFDDTFALSAVSSQGYAVSVQDTSGNPITQTPLLGTTAATSSYDLRVVVTIPAGASVGTLDVTTVRATSTSDPLSFDTATDTTAVGEITVTPAAAKSVAPGDFVEYDHLVSNEVLADDVDVVQTSPAGWRVDYLDGVTLFATDLDGDGDFTDVGDFILSGHDANANGRPDLAVASGGTRSFTTRITATSGSPVLTDVEPVSATSALNAVVATSSSTTTLRPAVELTPDHVSPSNFYAGHGMTVDFPHLLRNNSSSAAAFALSGTNPAGWTVAFLSDPDGNGDPSDGTVVTSSPVLANNGGEYRLVVRVTIPAAPVETATITTASATGTPGGASALDEVRIAQVATFRNASYSLQGTHFPKCDTVYAKGFTLAPGSAYTLDIRNPANTLVQSRSQVADLAGETFDTYLLGAGDAAGNWSVTLRQGGTVLDTAVVVVEQAGTAGPVATGLAAYPGSGAPVSFSAGFTNTASQSAYSGSRLRLVIRDLAASAYLTPAGTFAPVVTGEEDTAVDTGVSVPSGQTVSFASSVASVTFPVSPGVYRLTARWDNSCGSLIATASTDFLVGPVLATQSSLAPDQPATAFLLGDTVHAAGNVYVAGTSYRVGVWDPSGALVASLVSTPADGAGRITASWSSTAGSAFGAGWRMASYPLGALLPSVFPSSDPARFAVAPFELWAGTTAAPTVSPMLFPGDTVVSGSSTEPAGTVVELFVDGLSVGTTTVLADGSWSLSGLAPLVAGDVVTARARKAGFLESPDSAPVTVAMRLLRFALAGDAPPSPGLDVVFPYLPGRHSMDPATQTEASPFAAGGSWPNESTDLSSASPLVFYEVTQATNTLRVTKSAAGNVVVEY